MSAKNLLVLGHIVFKSQSCGICFMALASTKLYSILTHLPGTSNIQLGQRGGWVNNHT